MFELTKWYADAVSAAGDFWIGYCARLRCGAFTVSYSSVLDPAGSRHSLRASDVSVAGETVVWKSPPPGADGRWTSSAGTLSANVFRNEEGAVEWECLVPCGAASVGGLEGLGYVERLHLTIAPWRLPIRSLRWGRFLSDRHSVVWIDWLGEFKRRIVFLDGDLVEASRVDDDGLDLAEGARLDFDRGLVIREGALGSTVFRAVPGLDRIAPARMFHVEERKWRSAARLSLPGEPEDRGWAIHEVVTWP